MATTAPLFSSSPPFVCHAIIFDNLTTLACIGVWCRYIDGQVVAKRCDSYSSYFKYYWCRTNINAVGTSGLVSKTLTAGVHHVRVEAHLAWGCYRYGAINTNKAVSITRKSASQSSYTAFNPTFTHTALTEKGTASAAAAEKWSADCPYGQQTEYSSSHLSPLT